MKQGFIKLHRKLQECWIWEIDKAFDERSAWIDLLLSANHTDVKIPFNGELVLVERGQFITSVRKLSEKWKWNKDKVLKFLRLLESDKMIKRDSDKFRTLITIENYDIYQDKKDAERTQDSTPQGTADGHDTDTTRTRHGHEHATNKNVKNDKNDKNDKNVKNVKNNKESSAELLDRLLSDFTISEPLKEKIGEWIVYKNEKKQCYKETGLKTLLKQVANKEQEYGSLSVMDLIDDCMARNYSGIIWDKLKSNETKKADFVDMWRNA